MTIQWMHGNAISMKVAKRPQPMQVFIILSEENVHFKCDKKTPWKRLGLHRIQEYLWRSLKSIQKRHHSKGREKTPFISVPAGLPAVTTFHHGDRTLHSLPVFLRWRQIKWTINAIKLQARKRHQFLYLLVFLLWRLSTTVMSTSGLLFRDFFSDWNRNCKSYTLIKKELILIVRTNFTS